MKRHPHETVVLGLFKTPDEAHEAMDALEPLGYEAGDINLIASTKAYEREELVNFIAGEKLHQESVRAGKIGGLAGAVLGAATATAAILSAGASLLATAPLIAVIT